MPKSPPLPDWQGEDAYILGGGPSLQHFRFTQLVGKAVIGTNQAFLLGPEICPICLFIDEGFWDHFEKDLNNYGGWVATNFEHPSPPPWLCRFARRYEGLATREEGALGLNHCSGATAINLALLLGAKRVLLLGIDLSPGTEPGKTHWHDKRINVPTQEHYHRFNEGFWAVKQELEEKFPNQPVYNVHNGASCLKVFPSLRFEEVGLIPPVLAKTVIVL